MLLRKQVERQQGRNERGQGQAQRIQRQRQSSRPGGRLKLMTTFSNAAAAAAQIACRMVCRGVYFPAKRPESQAPSSVPHMAGPNSQRKPVSLTPRWRIRKTGADRT